MDAHAASVPVGGMQDQESPLPAIPYRMNGDVSRETVGAPRRVLVDRAGRRYVRVLLFNDDGQLCGEELA